MNPTKTTITILTLLLLIGCSGTSGQYTSSLTSKEIYSGKDGLTMEFFETAPPKEIFESGVLPVGIRLYNKGAYNIENGYLSLGFEKDYMTLNEGSIKSINNKVSFRDSEHITFELKGKDIENPKGDEDIITFTANVNDLSKTDPQSKYHNSLVAVTSCYEYQTKAVPTVCIDSDVYGFKQREKPCKVETLNLDSQGAPVAVTKVESEMLPSKDQPNIIKPRFIITVKNLGNGEAIKQERVEDACSSRPIDYKEWNNIRARVYLSTQEESNKLDCDIKDGARDDGIINLRLKEDSIRCTYEPGFEEKKGTFSSPLYIVLDYGYTDTISRDVKIKKIAT
ncbi:MAG: hypothetical protein ABIH64_07265 [Nanoarchaeota archaeon]